MKKKLRRAMNSKFTRIAVSSTVATVAGTVSAIAVGTALVKVPIGIGVRVITQVVVYSLTSNITYEVVECKLKRMEDNPYIEEAEVVVPPPPPSIN